MSLNGNGTTRPGAGTPLMIPEAGALEEQKLLPLGAWALSVREDPIQENCHWLVLQAEDGGYPLIHRNFCRDLAEVDEKKGSIQALLQSLGVQMATERSRDLCDGHQMAELRAIIRAIAAQVPINRELIDLDASRAIPYVLEGAREDDLVGLFFFAPAQRLVVLRGAMEGVPGGAPTPRFDSSGIAQFLGSGARPNAFLILKVTSSARVRFRVLEVCTHAALQDVETRVMELLGHPFSGLT